MVAQGDLIAAVLFCEAVEIPAAHAGAQVAGGLFDGVDGIEDVGAADLKRDAEQLRVFFNEIPVFRKISGIHAQKDERKGELVVTLKFLKELCHKHGVLAAGDADRDPVPFFHQLVLYDGLFKTADQIVLEGLTQGFIHVASVFFDIQTGSVNICFSVVGIHISTRLSAGHILTVTS